MDETENILHQSNQIDRSEISIIGIERDMNFGVVNMDRMCQESLEEEFKFTEPEIKSFTKVNKFSRML